MEEKSTTKQFSSYCKCGCGNGVVFKFEDDKEDDEYLSVQLVSDNFYLRQKDTLPEKLKRIWHIIWGKEYCYFDLLMKKSDVQEFKDFVSKL